jgi:P-type Cu2+ transporter
MDNISKEPVSDTMAKGDPSVTVKKQFPVTGMGCAACANRIEIALNKQPGVIKGVVNFATQTAQVEYNPDIIQPLQLKESIVSIGYDLITGGSENDREEAEDLQKKKVNP